MKKDICQAISNCKICKMESPNLGKYMNIHLKIGTVPMHFLPMDTIEIRDADSAYKYAFTLIDMLTNYAFVIPVRHLWKNISTRIHIQSVLTIWKNGEIPVRQQHELH